MSMLRKITNRTAQHTIEYTVLLILIMAGIIIASPYVVRSWNANLKGWSDSVQDSIQDPLIEQPLPPPLPGCEPGGLVPEGCGGEIFNKCTSSNFKCAKLTQMLFRKQYWPDGCQCAEGNPNYLSCVYDDSCCIYLPGPCAPANGCPLGTRSYTKICGSATTGPIVCGYMPGGPETFEEGAIDQVCVFQCQTPPQKITAPTRGYGNLCQDDEINLPAEIPYSYVNASGCTSRKCEIQCAPWPLGPVGGGTSCDCPLGYRLVPIGACTIP